MLRIGAATFRLGDGAGKRPRACAHLYGAVARGPHVGVHTNSPVHVDGQTRWALAAEGALRVDAASVHAYAGCLTLVDVSAVAPVGCECETGLADALKAAVLVDAHAVQTHVGGGTLVVIDAVLSIRSEFKSGIADALKASFGVDAAAVATHHSVHNTLIDVNASLFGRSSLVPLMTLAVVRARCVDTISINTGVTHTLIDIDAFPTNVLSVAHVAFTAVACRRWDAASIQAQVGKVFAHIDGVIDRNGAY